MLKTVRNRLNRLRKHKKSELKVTPGESVRDGIIKAGLKAAEESGYAAGNPTEKFVEIATRIGKGVDLGTQFTGGTESAGAIGRIAFKVTKDVARGDSICTGLCAVSGTCETIALGCSTIKIIPCRGRITSLQKL